MFDFRLASGPEILYRTAKRTDTLFPKASPMTMLSTLPIFAQQAAPGAPGPGAAGFGTFLPFILIIAIFYFMMIRPQQRKEKERKKQIEELRAGARILFAGGLIGRITEARESTFKVEVADGVEIEIARGAVIRPLKDGEAVSVDDAR